MKIRDLFPGYYQPTEEEFKTLWDESIFSFDANILLHIYRYSPETRNRLFEILQKLQERIWIPHQVAYEMHKNRIEVIYQQSSAYKDIKTILDKNIKAISEDLKKYKRHPLISIDEILETFDKAYTATVASLENIKKIHPAFLIHDNSEYLKNDKLWEKLINIIDNRVGLPYQEKDYKDKCAIAEQRLKNSIPPGYEDAKNKVAPDKFGDVLLWFQLVDHAKSEQKSIIFITDDNKDDWWLKGHGKTISPRPELGQEMMHEAQVKFYMYPSDKFLEYAENYLQLSEQPEAIEEARDIKLSSQVLDITIFNDTKFGDGILHPSNLNKNLSLIEIEVIDTNHTPISNAHIVLSAENSTYLESFTDNNGVAELNINPSKNYVGLIAHEDFSSAMIRNFPITNEITIKLQNKNSIGSVIFSRGTGYIRGLEGRLNPILDTFGRTYIYAENVAINGGRLQPVDFNINEPIDLEDSKGNVAQIIIRFISSNISLVDFVTNIS